MLIQVGVVGIGFLVCGDADSSLCRLYQTGEKAVNRAARRQPMRCDSSRRTTCFAWSGQPAYVGFALPEQTTTPVGGVVGEARQVPAIRPPWRKRSAIEAERGVQLLYGSMPRSSSAGRRCARVVRAGCPPPGQLPSFAWA